MFTPLLSGLALAVLPTFLVPFAPGGNEVELLTHDYVHKTFEQRDLDGQLALMSANVFFVDPTADVWGGPASLGVKGRDNLRRLIQSWNIAESSMHVQHSFVTGPYALYAGEISWQANGQAPVKGVPFCTVLKVADGAIVERRDYGDYDRLFPQAQGREAELAKRADRYFEAYRDDDPRTMDGLLADEAVYLDPTSVTVGEPIEVRGKYEILAMIEQAAGDAGDLEVDVRFRFYSNRHAFYVCQASYAIDGAELGAPGTEFRLEHPVVHVLEFEDGKVVEHRRYLDYAAAGRQIEAQRG